MFEQERCAYLLIITENNAFLRKINDVIDENAVEEFR